MQISEKAELRKFVKKTLDNVIEGSRTDDGGGGGYLTPKAFVGDEDGEPGQKALEADDTYTVKPAKEKRNFIKIHEVSYQQFKEDQSMSDVQKVNKAILEINRGVREINKILDHSMKLKTESKMGNEKLWKKTNEALIKISHRMTEAAKKTRKFANLKEIQATQAKEKLAKALTAAGVQVRLEDMESTQQGQTIMLDVYLNGEPHGFDITNNQVTYQDFDKEISVGYIENQNQMVDNLKKIFKNG